MRDTELSSSDQLDAVGVREILEHDPRPTFVLDLDPDDLNIASDNDVLEPLFCNEALHSHHILLDSVLGDSDSTSTSNSQESCWAKFRAWATSITKFDDSKDVYPLTYFYCNMLWTGSTVRKRWRLISGNQCYRVPDVPTQDLSFGPPGEVATGGYVFERTSRKDFGDPLSPSKSRSTVPVVRPKPNTGINGDTTNTSLTFTRRDEAAPERGKYSSRSSDGTGRTTESTWSLKLSAPEKGTPDWTVRKPKGLLSDHLVFARSIDWGSTPLGDMRSWSRELRQAANLVMSNPHPAALFWGDDLTMLYNSAYGDEVAGNKHPILMGTGAEGPFSEIWNVIGPLFVECARTGKAVRRENDFLPLERHGYLEEAYFSWSFTPLYGGRSKILGFYNAPFETTRDCIGQRRLHTLQQLGNAIAVARTVKEFWKCILTGLDDNHYDVPFALLYSVMDSDEGDEVSSSSGSTMSLKSCCFEGAIAVYEGHPAAPSKLDLKRSREGFIPSFREAMRTREPTILQVRDGTLPESLLEGIQWRGHGEPCKEAIIFPIRPTNGDAVLSFLLLGVNPRRAYDDDYKSFVNLMNRQLATALASVLLFEEEVRRTQAAIMAAALQQEELNEQLAVQTNRLQRMTALSPLGMFYINPEGLILEANDRYYEMTHQDRNDLKEMGWMDQLDESSKATMIEGWDKLTKELVPWTSELMMKRKRRDPINLNAEPIDYWVLASSQPEVTADGKLRSIMGSITDISHLKWAQGLQDRRLREAEETRRQQNEFIDITSHEMRNPLSAILQCADDIASTMTEYQSRNVGTATPVIDSCIESANTIALCVQHQKSIVDDILTISKLDSNLLELTPIPAQPVIVAKRVIRMFESELLAKNIKLSFGVNPDYEELGVDWVNMDPSRMSQVVINLMTNAIKFTSERPVREIKVSVAASTHVPVDPNIHNFQYIPRRNAATSVALGNDWNAGEAIYIRLKVEDTGCGLTPDEKQLLFQRFQQASPRTHAQYGGSGLGLFISRQLTELHGGQIGVASEATVGSTFGFYIRTRKIPPPPDAEILPPPAEIPLQPQSNANGQSAKSTVALSHMTNEMLRSIVAPKSPMSPTPQSESISSASLSILVVEDNLVNQKVLVRQLVKSGSEVSAADNGQQALDYLETTEFRIADGGKKLSVVLMDLEMPVMDGLTCVRKIRQMEREGVIKRHVPVIAVTANVRQEQISVAKEAGMDDVVSKPFRIPDLLAKIKILLSSLVQANQIEFAAPAKRAA